MVLSPHFLNDFIRPFLAPENEMPKRWCSPVWETEILKVILFCIQDTKTSNEKQVKVLGIIKLK